jgi:hypothetical protein
MDAPTLSALLPALAEPLGLAAIFALAIWGGVRVALAMVGAWREAELARIAVSQAMAETIRAHAETTAQAIRVSEETRRELAEMGITLRVIAQRTGTLPIQTRTQLHEGTGDGT